MIHRNAFGSRGSYGLVVAAALFSVACGPSEDGTDAQSGQRPTTTGALDSGASDFDIRGLIQTTLAAPPVALSDSRRELLEELGTAAPGELVVRYSEFTGSPSRLTRLGPPLTRAKDAPARDIATDFLDHYRELFDLSRADLKDSYFSRAYATRHNGVHHFTIQFLVSELDVFESLVTLNVNAEGRVINASGQPIPNASAYANSSSPALSDTDAIAIAARGAHVEAVASSKANRLLYFPIRRDELRLAWDVTFDDANSPYTYRSMVDAADGRLLWRKLLTKRSHIPAHGSVYASDSPIPNTPQGTSTGTVARQDLSFTGILDFPHDDPHFDWWAGVARTTTTSNNVDAFVDRDGDFNPDADPRPTAGAGEDFTFAIDLTQEPDTYQDAATTNLFYWNNRLHDFFYRLGFDEAAGNYQSDNFGLGGSGGDAVQAHAQFGADANPRALCNAFWSPTADGTPPRMRMFLCNRSTPERDGDLDVIVIGHEYGHGIHTRLVDTTGSQDPGEGWADYYGLTLVAEEDDPYAGNYGVGNYLFNKGGGEGIRQFPFSTDANVFQDSYADLNRGSGCAVLTCSSDDTETCTQDSDCSTMGDTCDGTVCQFQEDCEPPNTTISQGPCVTEVHYAGAIWANAILRARFNLVEKFGFDAGDHAMNLLVIDGMKLSDANPTFLDSRNKILEADEQDFGGANSCLIWDAFAKAGMGFTAMTTGTGDINPAERFDVPTFCSPVMQLNSSTGFGKVCAGAPATQPLEIYNTGAGDLIVTKIERTSGSADITIDAQPELPVFIGPDSHVNFTVRCNPTGTGLTTATFRITSNDAGGPTRTISYSCDRGFPDINVAIADSGDFGEVCSASHGDMTLTLFNQGSCDLRINTLTTVPGLGSFRLPADLDLPLILSHDADFSLPLRYAPEACSVTGEDGIVRMTTNDPDEATVNVAVHGNAPCGDIQVAIADSGNFGAVCEGDFSDLDITLFNQGRCDLRITNIELVPNSGSFLLPDDLDFPLILSHDADFMLPVRFAPEACSDDPEQATVRITTDDPDEPIVEIDISATSPCPSLVIDPAALEDIHAFPATVVDVARNLGCFSERNVNLRNNGACPLVIESIAAAGDAHALDFRVAEPTQFPITLPPGEETLGVTVRFAPQADASPTAPSELVGELTVVSNDPDGDATAGLCGESVTSSGVRLLVTQVASGTSVPLATTERIDIISKGVSQPGPINLTFTNRPLVTTTMCGRTLRYHVDQETLPGGETTGGNPQSSYDASAKQGSLQASSSFSLNQCEFKEVELQLRDSGAPGCVLLPAGAACTTDGQCCSGACQGPASGRTCRP